MFMASGAGTKVRCVRERESACVRESESVCVRERQEEIVCILVNRTWIFIDHPYPSSCCNLVLFI